MIFTHMHLAEDLVLKQALVKFCTQLELASAFMHKVEHIRAALCVPQRRAHVFSCCS